MHIICMLFTFIPSFRVNNNNEWHHRQDSNRGFKYSGGAYDVSENDSNEVRDNIRDNYASGVSDGSVSWFANGNIPSDC